MRVIISTYGDELGPATLVFKTIRIGFPTAQIVVYWNGGSKSIRSKVEEICQLNGYIFYGDSPSLRTNDDVIALECSFGQPETLVFVDADVVFWESVQDIELNTLVTGRLIPRHRCSYTGLVTEARLHPSLLFIKNGRDLKHVMPTTNSRFAPINVFKPFVFKHNGHTIFYDTCCNLYQFFGGRAFTKQELSKYDHLFCSSFVRDVSDISERLRGLAAFHESVYDDINNARGIWVEQQKYFNQQSL